LITTLRTCSPYILVGDYHSSYLRLRSDALSINHMWQTLFVSIIAKNAPVVVSIFSLLVASWVGLHNIISKRNEGLKSAREDFEETIEGLIDLKIEREKSRRELQDDWALNKYSAMRIGFNDKRELLLSKARFLLLKYRIDASEIAYITIGATLSDIGNYAESLEYYRQALEVAQTAQRRAFVRRPLGRALILSGQLNEGRDQLLKAAREISELIGKPGFDADIMRNDRADALRRLVWAELEVGERAHLEEDIKALSTAITTIQDSGRRIPLEKARDELREKALQKVVL
jgi:tetratricopeptide (TPR) repeat protein